MGVHLRSPLLPRDGGGYGSIIGRNVFQRERKAALELLDKIIKIYSGAMK